MFHLLCVLRKVLEKWWKIMRHYWSQWSVVLLRLVSPVPKIQLTLSASGACSYILFRVDCVHLICQFMHPHGKMYARVTAYLTGNILRLYLFILFFLSPYIPLFLQRNPVCLSSFVSFFMLTHRNPLHFWISLIVISAFPVVHFTSIPEASAWDDKTEVFIDMWSLLLERMLIHGSYSYLL